MSKYVTYAEYTNIYGEIDETLFNRLIINASVRADRLTTGLDGVKKLKVAFPTDEDDVEVVKAAICGVIHLMAQVDELEKAAIASQGVVTREDGTVVGKTVTSISSGDESISYSTTNSAATLAASILNDPAAQINAYETILYEGFRGIKDANGINLLFLGTYPFMEKINV